MAQIIAPQKWMETRGIILYYGQLNDLAVI